MDTFVKHCITLALKNPVVYLDRRGGLITNTTYGFHKLCFLSTEPRLSPEQNHVWSNLCLTPHSCSSNLTISYILYVSVVKKQFEAQR